MALTGELSDLSLAELIEFFCNQRKTGRLKVTYSIGAGYFYLQSGSVVHARIGILRGIEAVYYALTLPNASFTFSPAFDAPEQTINQPWTSVVLEGLRRMDEGVKPGDPFSDGHNVVEEARAVEPVALEPVAVEPVAVEPVAVEPMTLEPMTLEPMTLESVEPLAVEPSIAEDQAPGISFISRKFEKPSFKTQVADLPDMGAFIFQTDTSTRLGSWKLVTVIAAIALIVGVIAVPWGWYARSKAARLANESQTLPAQSSQTAAQPVTTNEMSAAPATSDTVVPSTSPEMTDLAAKRAREARVKERAAKAPVTGATLAPAQPTPAILSASGVKTQSSPAAGPKKATVQVTYDENGRVTQASGGDATALRIARQKRFPAGKAGSATITIPIN